MSNVVSTHMPEMPTSADTCTCAAIRSKLDVTVEPCAWHRKYRRAVRARQRKLLERLRGGRV